MTSDKPKPYVAIATLCEHVLEEKDSVLSVIRAVDTYHLHELPGNAPPGTTPVIHIDGVISLKSGDVTGEHRLSLVLENALHERTQVGDWPVTFNGGEHGVNMKLKLQLGLKHLGLCWFDVLFDGELLTKIPMRLNPPPASAAPTH